MSVWNKVDLDALLCALILAPNTFSRNRFFQLFEQPKAARVRRRAARVRGIIRQLVGDGKSKGVVIGERVPGGNALVLDVVAASREALHVGVDLPNRAAGIVLA